MHIYAKNIIAKFHPGLIWNDRALGFYLRGHPRGQNNNNNKKNKMSSDMRSVPDLKKSEEFCSQTTDTVLVCASDTQSDGTFSWRIFVSV